MNKWLKILLGLILIVIPLYLILPTGPLETWGFATLELIKGGITILVLLAGIIFVVFGISELKE